ncbi:hypothetical protein R1sor_015725 [Riccia sorocarpa]|uniref:BTB domain-containing protein n=1 Tax=Riccia sorocarpa TaxID=122646 RepID=A0ABD3HEU6_9MARC
MSSPLLRNRLIYYDEEEEEDTKLEVDLRKIVNSAELNDVTFLCEDGVPVYGCRILLAAWSSFFKTLLFGKMAESTKSSIHLPTVLSSVLIIVMKFLYTEKLLPEDFITPEVLCAGKRDVDGTCLPGPEVTMDYIDSLKRNEVTEESKRAEFDFTHLAKVYRGQAMRLSRQLRDTEFNVINVWHVLAHENARSIPSKDECTVTVTGRRKVLSFGAVIATGLVVKKIQGSCKWEFSVTSRGSSRGSMERQHMLACEFGFICIKLGEMFPHQFEQSLSGDVRCSAVRITAGCGKASIYCQGRNLKQWSLPTGTKFQWATPLQVTLNDDELGSCTFRYAGEEMRFTIPLPKEQISILPCLSTFKYIFHR